MAGHSKAIKQGPIVKGGSGFQTKQYYVGNLLVTEEDKLFVIGAVELDQIQAASLRNHLTSWVNAKRTRDHKRARGDTST